MNNQLIVLFIGLFGFVLVLVTGSPWFLPVGAFGLIGLIDPIFYRNRQGWLW